MGITIYRTNMLTDRLLRSWIRCRRKAWLDRFGDNHQRLWTPHRTLQLDHQQRSFAALIPQKAGKGIAACKKGDEGVLGIRLKGKSQTGHYIEAHPPLIQRIHGKSIWGDFEYRPVLARQGKRFGREHRQTLALTGHLLEQVQGSKVSQGLVISQTIFGLEKENVPINNHLINELEDSLRKLKEDLNKNEPPPLTSDRKKCSICSWRVVCNLEAKQKGHLSEVIGVGAKRKEMLQNIGVKNIKDLANSDVSNLEQSLKKFGEQHGHVAKKLIEQAKVQVDKIPKRIEKSYALPELIDCPGVLIYDIESDPDQKEDFLHGFLCLRRIENGDWDLQNSTYHPILTLPERGEVNAWKRVSKKLDSCKDWPILHYGETELITLCSLAKRQKIEEEEIDLISKRFIDIQSRLRKSWHLPTNSYGLKAVANWTGFEWRQKGAEGATALLWWRQWRQKRNGYVGNKNSLKWIFQYNQDDCLATWSVANWLLREDSF